MPSWQGKSKGNRTGHRIFVGVLRNFGVGPAYFLLRFVSAYYFLFSFKTSRFIYDFFHLRLGYGRFHSFFKVYSNYYWFGQTIIDRVVLMSGIPNRFSFDMDGEEFLHEMVAGKRGGLLLSAHIGNWEIAGHLLQRLDTQINIVMYDGEQQQLKDYLDGVTGKRPAHIILIKDDLSHIYAINDAFKNNELVCMHADRFMEGNKTLKTVFLGKEAAFPAGPFVLAASFRIPVSFVFAMKESSRHYHFYAGKSRVYNREPSAGMQAMLEDFVKEMENKIKKYPAQWYNYYDFWK